MIIVTSTQTSFTQMGIYFSVDLTDGKRSVTVLFAPPKTYNPVGVLVKNASHKIWRGLGRSFATVDDALAGYKLESVRSMIRHAAELKPT